MSRNRLSSIRSRLLLSTQSCGFPVLESQPLDLLKAHHVIDQVCHGDRRLVSGQPNTTLPRGSHAHPHGREDMLHPDSNPGPRPVASFLASVERSVSVGPLNGLRLHLPVRKTFLARRSSIGAIDIGCRIALGDEFCENLAIMNRGCRHREVFNEFAFTIDFHMVLIARSAAGRSCWSNGRPPPSAGPFPAGPATPRAPPRP